MTKKEKDFLTNYIFKTSNFYRQRKIHESEEFKKKKTVETQKI